MNNYIAELLGTFRLVLEGLIASAGAIVGAVIYKYIRA